MKFIGLKTEDGVKKGKLSLYCRVLGVTRQGFYKYLKTKDKLYKYTDLIDEIKEIIAEDECNDMYGYKRIYEALKLKNPDRDDLPSRSTFYRILKENKLIHKLRRKPNGITKEDRNARKSDDLLKRDFKSEAPLEKAVTDITEIKCKDGKLYVSAIFDCFDLMPLGISIADNMKAELCVETIKNAKMQYPEISGCILHSDRGSQYTSRKYREALKESNIVQSMNSDGGRCHDNARCESIWGRMKTELLYDRYNTEKMTMKEVKEKVWRYFMSYWKNRRICSAIGGMPPAEKRRRYYEQLADEAA